MEYIWNIYERYNLSLDCPLVLFKMADKISVSQRALPKVTNKRYTSSQRYIPHNVTLKKNDRNRLHFMTGASLRLGPGNKTTVNVFKAYLRPWPAVSQMVVSKTERFFAVYTTDTSSVNWSNVKPKYFLGSLDISNETPNTFNRFDWGLQSQFGEYFWLPFYLFGTGTRSRIKTIVICGMHKLAEIHNNF